MVPAEGRLEIEGMVSPRHRLRPSRAKGEIKIDTFTRYGLLQGVVLSCDRPRQAADKTGDKVPGAESTTSEPKGQELGYAARVSLDRSQMKIDDNLVNLAPGMAVTVEIKTGSRTVISYLLSPLLRYKHESLRER